MLIEIKELLAQRVCMSLHELAIHFESDPSSLEPMLEQLVRKGVVRRFEVERCTLCANCTGCAAGAGAGLIFYEML